MTKLTYIELYKTNVLVLNYTNKRKKNNKAFHSLIELGSTPCLYCKVQDVKFKTKILEVTTFPSNFLKILKYSCLFKRNC